MTPIYDVLRDMAHRLGPPVEEHADAGWLQVTVTNEEPAWTLVAEAHEDRDQAIVYAIRHALVPENRREAAALLLTRLNQGLYLGNFELDLDDGEVRFKASIDFGGVAPTIEQVRPLLAAATMTMERYLPEVDAATAA